MSKRANSPDPIEGCEREKMARKSVPPSNHQKTVPEENGCNLPSASPEFAKVTLQSLPCAVLDNIFQYVHSRDLAKLCCVSKSLYWPAVNRMYNYLVLCDNSEKYYPFEEAEEDDVDYKDLWKINYGTVIQLENVYDLVETLESNEELRPLVHGISIKIAEFNLPLGELLALTPNLKAYHDNFRVLGFSQNVTGPLKYVSMNPPDCPKLSPNLVELKILDHEDTKDERYKAMALNMLQSNADENLRRLHFATAPPFEWEQPEPNTVLNSRATWLSFLSQFKAGGVKLNLDALGLHGWLRPREATDVLKKSIRLDVLRSLVLKIGNIPVGEHTFLDEMTQHTPKLESLAIYPSNVERRSEVEDICDVLENNLPHQLKELYISYFPEGYVCREFLQSTILSFQSNLVNLKLEDGLTLRDERTNDFRIMIQFGWEAELTRQCYFPKMLDGFHNRPANQKGYERAIRKNLKTLHDGLMKDLIYTEGEELLPCLSQYFVGGVFVDMKQKGIFVNDETIRF